MSTLMIGGIRIIHGEQNTYLNSIWLHSKQNIVMKTLSNWGLNLHFKTVIIIERPHSDYLKWISTHTMTSDTAGIQAQQK